MVDDFQLQPSDAVQALAAKGIAASTDTIRRWCDIGKLASRRTPTGRRLISKSSLSSLIRERKAGR